LDDQNELGGIVLRRVGHRGERMSARIGVDRSCIMVW
jgi:hypothetical protein